VGFAKADLSTRSNADQAALVQCVAPEQAKAEHNVFCIEPLTARTLTPWFDVSGNQQADRQSPATQ
jgi:hypothetical protein